MALANNNKNQRGQYLNKFIKIFFMVFAIAVILMGLMTVGYYLINDDGASEDVSDNSLSQGQEGDDTSGGDSSASNEGTESEKGITTVAVFGTDKDGYRTDVTMLVFFNRETMALDVVSIPRDTYIKLPDSIYEELVAGRPDTPDAMKINEVPAYCPPEKRNETSVAVIESVFGVDVDYYVGLDLNGFVAIVDLIQPIPMTLEEPMVYSDPIQGLYINLDAGEQGLNGTQALGLVRYRSGYGNGDIGRIDMQHKFMEAFVEKLLTLENRINIVNIAATALLYMDTDFTDAIDYVNYIDDIDVNKIHMTTLPGQPMPNASYYGFDYEETKLLLNKIIHYDEVIETVEDTETVIEDEDQVIEPVELIDAKQLTISVQNGTMVGGLAGRTSDALSIAGYNVLEAVDYPDKDPDNPVSKTILQVPRQDVGEEIAGYFNNPEIEVVEAMMDQETQVIVILGGTDGETY